MYISCLIMYVFISIGLILCVVFQHGKGIDMGSDSYGIRNTLGGLGNSPVSDYMTRTTTILGILFFILSLLLGNFNIKYSIDKNTIDDHGELKKLDVATSSTHVEDDSGS